MMHFFITKSSLEKQIHWL